MNQGQVPGKVDSAATRSLSLEWRDRPQSGLGTIATPGAIGSVGAIGSLGAVGSVGMVGAFPVGSLSAVGLGTGPVGGAIDMPVGAVGDGMFGSTLSSMLAASSGVSESPKGGGIEVNAINSDAAAATQQPAQPPASGFMMSPPVAQPSRPALPPGAAPSVMPFGGGMPVPVNRFGIPEATPEALAAAVFRAQQVEAAGLEAIRSTGQIPRGPPDLPSGTEVIEQKCVAYLIGKGGQALAAINAAAGVSIQIDQSTKTFGWSMANIYGTEEGTQKAKMILRQKISEYRPLRA